MSTFTKIKWITVEKLRSDRFEDTLLTREGKKSLDAEFIKSIAERKLNLEKAYWKIAIVNIGLISVLFLNSSIAKTEFSISGISSKDIGKIKEVLLFASATLTFFSAFLYSEVNSIDSLIRTYVRQLYKGSAYEFVTLKFGPLTGQLPTMQFTGKQHLFPTVVANILIAIFFISMLVVVITYAVVSLVVSSIIVFDIVKNPALPWLWSWFVIAYVAFAYIASIGLVGLRWIPLPYRDYSLVYELKDLKKSSPELYRQKLVEETRKSK